MSTPSTIVQLADVKAHLNLEDNANDTELRDFIEAATPVVEKIAGPVIEQTVVETFDGGNMQLDLSYVPLVSVTSVVETVAGVNTALTPVTMGESTTPNGYTLDAEGGRIIRRSGSEAISFPYGVGNIAVTYIAGRNPIPKNIRLATLMLIQHWWQQSQMNRNGGRPSFGGDDALNMGAGYAIPNRVRELLQPDPQLPGVA